jgi:hypothetical protein
MTYNLYSIFFFISITYIVCDMHGIWLLNFECKPFIYQLPTSNFLSPSPNLKPLAFEVSKHDIRAQILYPRSRHF